MNNDFVVCQWCGSAAYPSGPQYFGSGLNSQTFVCAKCHAFCVFIRHSDKRISEISFDAKYFDHEEVSGDA